MVDMNYYGYKIGIYYEQTRDYFVDRGIIKAYDYIDAMDKLSKEFVGENGTETITGVELWELDKEEMEADIFSIYTFLSDSVITKEHLVEELKKWHLI